MALLAMQAEAQLTINGKQLAGVEVKTFNLLADGTLTLTTAGNETIVVDGDGGSGGTPTEPEPQPEPEPEPEPEPSGPCISGSSYVCAYNITSSNWSNKRGSDERLSIPQGKALVSTFTTSSSTSLMGMISFQAKPDRPLTQYWISTEPNGPAVANCSGRASFLYSIKWYQFERMSYTCNLAPSTTYFLNLKHSSSNQRATTVYRSLN